MFKKNVDYNPFVGGELARVVPSTEAQKEIWASVQMGDDANRAFNESVTLSLLGDLDLPAMQAAFRELVGRHEALRTNFSPDGESICIHSKSDAEIEYLDLTALASEAREHELQRLIELSVDTAFDLVHGALFGARLCKLDDQDHRLIIFAHHIVCDGWSMTVIATELGALYADLSTGNRAGLEAPGQFGDYALCEWELIDSAESRKAEEYWQAQYQDLLPRLDFPVDHNRPVVRTYTAKRTDYRIDDAVFAGLRKLSSEERCTFVTTLLAGFVAYLYRLTMQKNLVVGIPAAGQSATGQVNLVGHCVNLLPMRFDVEPDVRFVDLLKRVRSLMLDAYENQNYTFGSLVRKLQIPREPGRIPLMPILFNIDQVSDEPYKFGDLTVRYQSNPRHFENFEINLNVAASSREIVLECTYNTNLFDEETILSRMKEYERFLESTAESKTAKISELTILPDEEVEELLTAPVTDLSNASLLELFATQVERQPDAVAVCFGDRQTTYSTLDEDSNRFANLLKSRGVKRGEMIGVSMERSEFMLVVLLGILKSGASYIPLDPAYPSDRLVFMVQDSGLKHLVTEATISPLFSHIELALILLEDVTAELSSFDSDQPDIHIDPDDLAYTIYTSGSTGKPKGVCVQHAAVANFLQSMQRTPGIKSGDRLLAVTTLSFDIAVLELYLPLISGATVIVSSREVSMDGVLLERTIVSERVSVMQATPATWRMLLDSGWKPQAGFKALCGGEAMPDTLAKTLAGSCELWNMYGPTETTVWSSCYKVPASGSPVYIGKPIANTTFYVLDPNGQLLPAGVAGELFIGGRGVTKGYLGRSELTASRFIRDSFSNDAGALIYKTGDIVRRLNDGNYQYFNRADNQIKLRGFRIELGEIETVLADQAGNGDVAVHVHEFAPGDQRLVAYVAAESEPDFTAIRDSLKSLLPLYMVPQHFVRLDQLPQTSNGKLDRNALPLPDGVGAVGEESVEPPQTETETRMHEMWSEVLGVERLSVTTDFFEAGGHSLLGIQLLAKVADQFEIQVPLSRLFEYTTIRKLSAFVDDQSGQQLPSGHITKLEDGAQAPLSIQQQRIWFLDKMDEGNLEYNLPASFILKGMLDHEALKNSIRTVVDRHAVLRSRFVSTGHHDQDNPDSVRVDILDTIPLELEPVDLTAQCGSESDKSKAIEVFLDELVSYNFDLAAGPLFIVRLAKLADDEHLLFLMPHHIVFDGWSFDILLQELSTLYRSYSNGESPLLPELPIAYTDFAAWQRGRDEGEEAARQLAYWQSKLSGELPVLDLPTDYPRPKIQTHTAGSVDFELDKGLIDELDEFAKQQHATLYMLVLAAYTIILSKYAGQDEVIIGTPISGRNWAEINQVIGFFVNTLIIRNLLDKDATLGEFIKTVRDNAVEAFSNQDIPFERLVQDLNIPRDVSRSAVFQTLFMYQDVRNRKNDFGELGVIQVNKARAAVQTDLDFWVKRTNAGMVGAFEYSDALFREESVRSMLDHLLYLLRNMPQWLDVPLSQLDIIPEQYRHRMLSQWNDTAQTFSEELTLHGLIGSGLAAASQGGSVVFREREIPFDQLDRESTQLAHHLIERGVRVNTLVGICMGRSEQLLLAVLSIWKAGGAYLPLDPEYPRERLQFMVEDSGLELILADKEIERALPDVAAEVIRLDEAIDGLEQASSEPPAVAVLGEDLAYVIYTSGSTGKPKGVQIPHRAGVNFLQSMAQEPGLKAGDTLAAVTTLSFDISVLELYLPLVVGARLVIVDRQTASDGQKLKQLLERESVNVMQATPSTWRLLLGAGWQGSETFKALCGGEAMTSDLAAELRPKVSALWNMYGPTETTVWSSCYSLPSAESPILIGKPIANTQLYVLDRHGKLVPPGVKGELHIGGRGLSLGYLNRPELTDERFVPDRFCNEPGARLYRTGDLVRYRTDGSLEYLSRLDSQVKLRGFRIELGEIESVLSSFPKIRQVAVDVRENSPGDQRLVAYYVLEEETRATSTELRKHLRQSLPDYMIPQHFMEMESLPLTPNGKVDKKSMPSPFSQARAQEQHEPPASDAERAMATIWSEVVGVEKVGRHDNFFELGGHSLLAIKVVARAKEEMGMDVSLRMLVSDTLSQIVRYLGKESSDADEIEQVDIPDISVQSKPQSGLLGKLKSRIFSSN